MKKISLFGLSEISEDVIEDTASLRFDTFMEAVLDAEIEAAIAMNGLSGTVTRNANNTYTLI